MGRFQNTHEVSLAVRHLAAEFAAAGASDASVRLETHVSSFWTTTTEFLVELLTLLDELKRDAPLSLRGAVADLRVGVKDLAQLS